MRWLLAVVLVWVSFPSLAAEPDPLCKVAKAHVDYPEGVDVGADLRSRIDAYRQDWQRVCASPKKKSIAPLLGEADSLADQLTRRFDRSPLTDGKSDALEAIAKFVPAVHWACCESTGFYVEEIEFDHAARIGVARDREFFSLYKSSVGEHFIGSAWIKRTWDYGGCVRFADFDWSAEIDRIARLQPIASADAYRSRAVDLKTSLLRDELGNAGMSDVQRCVCTDRGQKAVVGELRAVSAKVQTMPMLSEYKPGIDALIEAIHGGRVKVISDETAHCAHG